MKLLPLIHRLVGATVLTALAAVTVAMPPLPWRNPGNSINAGPIPPRVQLALYVDTFGGGAYGAIHRVDTRTGKYLGYFGEGLLFYPNAIAVQPGTGVVYVADTNGITMLDMSTGDYLGFLTGNSAIGGEVESMRFNPNNGNLYTVTILDNVHYEVAEIDPTSGAVLASATNTTDWVTRVSVGFRKATGNVEVFDSYGGATYADHYPADLSSYLTGDFVSGEDAADFRTSSDTFVRVTGASGSYVLFGGTGAFSSGSEFETTNGLSSPMFAEAALNQTYLSTFNSTVPFLIDINTSSLPFVRGGFTPASFTIGGLSDVAIYTSY